MPAWDERTMPDLTLLHHPEFLARFQQPKKEPEMTEEERALIEERVREMMAHFQKKESES